MLLQIGQIRSTIYARKVVVMKKILALLLVCILIQVQAMAAVLPSGSASADRQYRQ